MALTVDQLLAQYKAGGGQPLTTAQMMGTTPATPVAPKPASIGVQAPAPSSTITPIAPIKTTTPPPTSSPGIPGLQGGTPLVSGTLPALTSPTPITSPTLGLTNSAWSAAASNPANGTVTTKPLSTQSPSTYTGTSIVDYLTSTGKPSDFSSRTQLAAQYGIQNYTGTAEQNTQLLNLLRSGTPPTTAPKETPITTPPVAETVKPTGALLPAVPVDVNGNAVGTPSTASYTNSSPTAQAGLIQQSLNMINDPNNPANYGAGANIAEQQRIINESRAARQANAMNDITLSQGLNRSGVLQGLASNQVSALAAINQQAENLRSQNLGALGTAAGQMAPIQVGPTTRVMSPTGGTVPGGEMNAFGGGQVLGQQALGQQAATMFAALNMAKTVKNNISGVLASAPELNPSDFNGINGVLQMLNGQVSNPKYQSLANALNEYITTIAPLLGSSGDVTNMKTQIAQSMINGGMSQESLMASINFMEQMATDKYNSLIATGTSGTQPVATTPIFPSPTTGNLSGVANGILGTAGSVAGAATGSGGSSGSNTITVGGSSFVLPY